MGNFKEAKKLTPTMWSEKEPGTMNNTDESYNEIDRIIDAFSKSLRWESAFYAIMTSDSTESQDLGVDDIYTILIIQRKAFNQKFFKM